MSVRTFEPDTDRSNAAIAMSDAARAHLLRELEKSPHRALKLGIKESGCSGYMYVLDFVDTPEGDDVPVAVDDAFTLYVSAAHLPLVNGTEIDYVREGLNAFLKFDNPNAQSECGCGESFSV